MGDADVNGPGTVRLETSSSRGGDACVSKYFWYRMGCASKGGGGLVEPGDMEKIAWRVQRWPAALRKQPSDRGRLSLVIVSDLHSANV